MLILKSFVIGSVLLKGSEWGPQLYHDCPMRVEVEWLLPKVIARELSFDCEGDKDRYSFGSKMGPFEFTVGSNDEVFFENKKVGSFANKRFEATFVDSYEENVYLRFRLPQEAGQSLNAVWSVDSFDYPSFDAWTEAKPE